jgi:hypothetical protein
MPQTSALPVGETVDVIVHTAVITVADPLTVSVNGETLVVPGTDAGGNVDVRLVQPANWPPQPGDVWTDGSDTKWFGVQAGANVGLVAETGGGPQAPSQVKQAHRPLVLSYRTA